MPFEGRTPREASQACKESLNRLLSHTITHRPLIVMIDRRSEVIKINFRQDGLVTTTRLQTRYGPMELFVGQTYDTVDGQHERERLRLIEYRYTLTPAGFDDPLFRWEFVRAPSSGSFWCRNHLQGPISVNVGGRSVNLNDWHLPTGWVPIEEIIRFCIVDLGVSPLDTSVDANVVPGWHTRLTESHERSASSY